MMKTTLHLFLFFAICILLTGSSVFGQTLKLVSLNKNGDNGGNRSSYRIVISRTGRFVAFTSEADDLTSVKDTNASPDIFLGDLWTGKTSLVSINNKGTASCNAGATLPAISADGRFVAFTSNATDLLDAPTTGLMTQVYVRDMVLGKTTLVSAGSDRFTTSTSPTVTVRRRRFHHE